MEGKMIDVTGFGAVSGEPADSSQAIIRAVEAAGPGDVIYFPSGTYYVNCENEEGIPLKSSICLKGQEGSILRTLGKEHFIFSITNKRDITITGLTFEGMGLSITGKSENITLKDCKVSNCGNGPVPKCFGIYLNDVSHCCFFNNKFSGNRHCFFGEGISDSQWKYNTFTGDEEALHLIGTSTNNNISFNKLRYIGRIGIEIQDDATGLLMEENDIRYMTGGMYGISFAAPYTRQAVIRNNVLVGGTEFKWGAGIEVMGRVTVEQNIVYDWQEGIQLNTGYQEYMYGPVLDGATVKNNLLRNQVAAGIMKVECGDTKNLVIKSNFIENSQLNGIHFFWDQTYGALIEDNTILRHAGYWPDDHIPFELRDIENYGDEDWFVLPVKRPDQNGYQYYNTSHFAGIRIRHNSKPANIIRNNLIHQTQQEIPEGFKWDGIVFDYRTGFQGTRVENNVIYSNRKGSGTGVDYLYEHSLEGVNFSNNHFENLETVIKTGEPGEFTAHGNVSVNSPDGLNMTADTGENEEGSLLVDAGKDQVVLITDTVAMAGRLITGAKPAFIRWEKFAGPGEVNFEDPCSPETKVSFSRPGNYVLSLNARNGQYKVTDVAIVQVGTPEEPAEALPEAVPPKPPQKLPSPIGGPGPSYEPVEGFLPLLLKVDVSGNLLDPGDDLWVTAWWQNIGSKPAEEHLNGFMEMEFGNQRIPENIDKYHKIVWQPFPGLHNWKQGDVWATTCRWSIPESGIWGGTYKLYLGFCNDERIPSDIWGTAGNGRKRAYIGEVDVSWGWGSPSLKQQCKPWSTEFCTPVKSLLCAGEAELSNIVVIGTETAAVLDAESPLLLEIKNNKTCFRFGQEQKQEICIRDKRKDELIYSYNYGFEVKYTGTKADTDTMIYSGEASCRGKKLAVWELVYRVRDSRLTITLENVREEGNFELLEIRMPSLISISGSDARMVDFFGDGRLISPEASKPMGYEQPYDVRNAGVLYNSDGMLVLETPGLDDKLFTGISENNSGKKAFMGAALVSKIRGRNHVRSIPVLNPPTVHIDLLGDSWRAPSWQAAARFLRQGLKGKNRELYKRSIAYKYLTAWGPHPGSEIIDEDTPYPIRRLANVNTFKKAFDTIKRVHNLIDGGRQVVYLTGFQCNGHDTGYPYVFETDPRAGTIEELKKYISEAPAYNAYLGMHDNYDDAYYTDHLPREILALNEEGKPYKIWFWSSGMSYAIGPVKYGELALMQKRVRQTVETYGIHTTYHLDVLSSEVRRYDFDMTCPRAADENLQGKKLIVGEFNKYGIDITSENLTHPFVGTIGYAWWTRHNPGAVLFFGEQNIPLTPMVYHGVLQYNCSGTSRKELLEGMIRGAQITWSETEQEIGTLHIRAYYLQNLPMGLLYDKKIEDYQENGSKVKILYEDNSWIIADTSEKTYEIAAEGRVIARDWVTLAPGFKAGSYLCYSLDGGELDFEAPEGWYDGIALRAVILTDTGEGEELPCKVEGCKLAINMPADKPVRIMPTVF